MNDTQSTTNQTAKNAPGRDQTGRFAKGNRGGPGNPFARKVAELRRMLVNSVTPEDIGKVARVLVEQAMDGDVASAKLLFQYTLGKPDTVADPDYVDVDDWKLLVQSCCRAEEMGRIMTGVPVDMATKLTSIAWPGIIEANLSGPLGKGIAQLDRRDEKAAKGKKSVPSAECSSRTAVERMVFGDGSGKAPSANGDNGAGHSERR